MQLAPMPPFHFGQILEAPHLLEAKHPSAAGQADHIPRSFPAPYDFSNNDYSKEPGNGDRFNRAPFVFASTWNEADSMLASSSLRRR